MASDVVAGCLELGAHLGKEFRLQIGLEHLHHDLQVLVERGIGLGELCADRRFVEGDDLLQFLDREVQRVDAREPPRSPT